MSTFNGLVNKLKKFTRFTSAKFKAPKAIKVKNELDKLATFIEQFNDKTDKDLFKSKVSQIFKSPTAISNYYKPGENEKDVYQKSGLAGIIFQELYTYLTTKFIDNNIKNRPDWFACSNQNALKTLFKITYSKHFGNDKAWLNSVLYDNDVVKSFYNLVEKIRDNQIERQLEKEISENSKKSSKPSYEVSTLNEKIMSDETVGVLQQKIKNKFDNILIILNKTTNKNKDKNLKEITKIVTNPPSIYPNIVKILFNDLHDYLDNFKIKTNITNEPNWLNANSLDNFRDILLHKIRQNGQYTEFIDKNVNTLFNIVKKIKELAIDNNKNESPKTHQATKPKQSKKEVRFDKSVTIAYRDPEVSTDTEDLKDEPKKTI